MNNAFSVNNAEEFVSDLTSALNRVFDKEKEIEVLYVPSIIKDGEDCPAVQVGGVDEPFKACIYLTEAFLANVVSYDDLIDTIVRIYWNSDTPVPDIDNLTNFLNNWSEVSKVVMPVVFDKKRYNSGTVSKDIEGTSMAVFYNIPLQDGASTKVTIKLLMQWGISIEVLHLQAMRNLEAIEDDYVIRDMNEIIAGMMPSFEEEPVSIVPEQAMLVGSNWQGVLGANIMLLKNMMKKVRDMIGNFLILPSSVHELIFVPVDSDAGVGAAECANIVGEVNNECVAPADYLANSVYVYDFEKESVVDAMSDREKYLSFLIANCG